MLNQVISTYRPEIATGSFQNVSSLAPITAMTLIAILMSAMILVGFWFIKRSGHPRASITWDCGYALPQARMQYTASSFAQSLVRLFRSILRPHRVRTEIAGPFPQAGSYASHVDDVILERFILPTWRWIREQLVRLRVIQQGSIQVYLVYILIILFVLLAFAVPMGPIVRWVVSRGF